MLFLKLYMSVVKRNKIQIRIMKYKRCNRFIMKPYWLKIPKNKESH
jgi:hypothetical protein